MVLYVKRLFTVTADSKKKNPKSDVRKRRKIIESELQEGLVEVVQYQDHKKGVGDIQCDIRFAVGEKKAQKPRTLTPGPKKYFPSDLKCYYLAYVL